MERKQLMQGFALLFSLLVSAYSQASLVINEIMYNPSVVADSAGEWFELSNTGSSTLNLNGWTLFDEGSNSFSINQDLLVASGDFVVLARNGDPLANGGVVADYVYGSGMTLSNTRDAIIISNAAGIEMDRVAWSSALGFPSATGASLALLDTALDNSLGSSWQLSNSAYGGGDSGTPGLANFFVVPAPVPEPSTWLMLGLGLLLLSAMARSGDRGRALQRGVGHV